MLLGIVVLAVVVGAAAVITRNAGWWPESQRREISERTSPDTWVFTNSTAELVCRVHWGGRESLSVRADGKEYDLSSPQDLPRVDGGFQSVQELVDRASTSLEKFEYEVAVGDLSDEARSLCHR